MRQFVAVGVQYFNIQILDNLARRAELVAVQRVGRNHRRRFRQAVALHDGHPDCREKALQLNVEQCAAADKEPELSAKTLSDFGEQDFVKECIERLQKNPCASAPVVAVAVVGVSHAQAAVEKPLSQRAFLADSVFDVFAEGF